MLKIEHTEVFGWDAALRGMRNPLDSWHKSDSYWTQRRTVQLNYQVLQSMYFARRNHKLDCWIAFCDWALTLPHFRELVLINGCAGNA